VEENPQKNIKKAKPPTADFAVWLNQKVIKKAKNYECNLVALSVTPSA